MWLVAMLAPLALVAPLHLTPLNGTSIAPSVPTTTVKSVPQQTSRKRENMPTGPKNLLPSKVSNKPHRDSEQKVAKMTVTAPAHKTNNWSDVSLALKMISSPNRIADKSKPSPQSKVVPNTELKSVHKSKSHSGLSNQTKSPKPEPPSKPETSKERSAPGAESLIMAPVPAPARRNDLYAQLQNNKYLQGSKQWQKQREQLDYDIKEKEQRYIDDYGESQRIFAFNTDKTILNKLDPALAKLLPKSKLHVDDFYPDQSQTIRNLVEYPGDRGRFKPQLEPSRRSYYQKKSPQRHHPPRQQRTKMNFHPRRPPKHISSLEPDFNQPQLPPRPPPLVASEHRQPDMPRYMPRNSREYQKRKENNVKKIIEFIKGNKGLLHELMAEKRARAGLSPELAGEVLRIGLDGVDGGPVMRTGDREQMRPEELDLVHARGAKIAAMRDKGRICARSVLKSEGPKYRASGSEMVAAWNKTAKGPFANTPKPKQTLPICCNCCMKSVLGCE